MTRPVEAASSQGAHRCRPAKPFVNRWPRGWGVLLAVALSAFLWWGAFAVARALVGWLSAFMP
jgi:hypothetical protein